MKAENPATAGPAVVTGVRFVLTPRGLVPMMMRSLTAEEPRMIRRGFALVLLAVVLCWASPARAQGTNLSQVLVQLIQADILLAPPQSGFSHEAHFVPGATQEIAPFFFNKEIITQLATFPTGSSSGGFTYTFDPALGTFSRASDSFGPAFAERALTAGKGKLNFGINYQHSSYDSFEGLDLQNGDVKFFLRHEQRFGAFFEGDLIEAALKLKLSTTTVSFFANYGVADNFDVSVGIPIVRASLDATVDATVLRLATDGSNPPIHEFVGGGTTATFNEGGSKTGFGDILVRAKYRFMKMSGGGLALEVGGRLPTGDSDNLLGTGAAQGTFSFIASGTRGNLAPHLNVGFTVAGDSDVAEIPNEFAYRGGVDVAVSPRVTLSGDLLGRALLNHDHLVIGDTTFNFTTASGTAGSRTFSEFQLTQGTLNSLLGAVGGKFNVARNMLVSVNVLFGLTSKGLRSNFTPVFGLDYSF